MPDNKYNKYSEELSQKYEKRYMKKYEDKPESVMLIASRTFSTAVHVLTLLENIPFEVITKSVYVYCKDTQFQKITREYEGQLELAGANPERFIFELHSFYNKVSAQVKKNRQYSEIAEFLSAYMRIQHTTTDVNVNRNIAFAYTDLILQTLEYLRPDKFDLRQCIIGVSTNGEPLVGKQHAPFSDIPALKLKEMMKRKIKFTSQEHLRQVISKLYAEQGIDVQTEEDLSVLEHTQRIQSTTFAALLPYINEYTSDILPQTHYSSIVAPLMNMTTDIPYDDIISNLKARKRTLPLNGVMFDISDPTGEMKSLLLKEIVKGNTVIMLYRLSTEFGDTSGYFNTQDGFLFSITRETSIPSIYENFRLFILYCYAICVTNRFSINEAVLSNNGQSVSIKMYGIGGKLKNVYDEPPKSGISRTNNPDYAKQTIGINGFIRKLPEGQKASPDAIEIATLMGYELEPEETYVRPFSKTVFVRAEESLIT